MGEKQIRTLHALVKSCVPYEHRYGFFKCLDYSMAFFTAIRGEKYTLLYNDKVSYSKNDVSSIISSDKKLAKVLSEVPQYASKVLVIPNAITHRQVIEVYLTEITLLDGGFVDEYNKWVEANKKLYERMCYTFDYGLLRYVYYLSHGSKNIIEWMINVTEKYGVRICTFRQILQWRDDYPNQSKELSRGSITSYTKYDAMIELRREINNIKKTHRANEVISKFNTVQKKLLRSVENKDLVGVLNKFYRLSTKKQHNFIKKVSSIDNYDELVRELRHVTADDYKWNKQDFIDYLSNVEGLKYSIIVNDGPIVLISVSDYETIKRVAKTTNWCISKNKYYWDNYLCNGDATQYVLYDFSKKEDDNQSIVGFTASSKSGITHAHDFINNNVMPSGLSSGGTVCHLNRLYSEPNIASDIYGILTKANINFSLFMKCTETPYEWSRDGIMKHLSELVDMSHVKVLLDTKDKLVVSVCDGGIAEFFGSPYRNRVASEYWVMKHIIFCDFTSNPFINKCMIVAIIDEDQTGLETCFYIDDKSFRGGSYQFERVLIDYELPYDIIKRPVSKEDILAKGILNFTYKPFMTDGMTKDEVKNVICTMVGNSTFSRLIDQSMSSFQSFDYLDLAYNNGYLISENAGCEMVARIITNLLSSVYSSMFALNNINLPWPTEVDIETLYKKEITSRPYAIYVFNSVALDTIIRTELKADKPAYKSIMVSGPLDLMLNQLESSAPVGLQYSRHLYGLITSMLHKSDRTDKVIKLCTLIDEIMAKHSSCAVSLSSVHNN